MVLAQIMVNTASNLKEKKQVLRMFNSTILKLLEICTIQLRNPGTQAK